MTRYLLLFLIVLCWQAASVTAQASSCAEQNPFLAELVKSRRIVPLDEPSKVENYCGGEWLAHGTCCQPESAVKFARVDKSTLSPIVTEVANSMKLQQTILSQLKDDLLRWVDKSPLSIQDKHSSKNRFLDLLKAIGGIKVKIHQKCWVDELTSLRSASLCSTCSGRSHEFFKDGKALVSQETCTSMMASCFGSIDQVVNFILATQEFYGLLRKLGRSMSIDLDILKDSSMKTIFEAINKRQISSTLKDYVNQGQNSNNPAAMTLCKEFMALHKDPFIFQIVDLMIDLLNGLYALKIESNSAKWKIEEFIIKKKEHEMQNGKTVGDKILGFFKLAGHSIGTHFKHIDTLIKNDAQNQKNRKSVDEQLASLRLAASTFKKLNLPSNRVESSPKGNSAASKAGAALIKATSSSSPVLGIGKPQSRASADVKIDVSKSSKPSAASRGRRLCSMSNFATINFQSEIIIDTPADLYFNLQSESSENLVSGPNSISYQAMNLTLEFP